MIDAVCHCRELIYRVQLWWMLWYSILRGDQVWSNRLSLVLYLQVSGLQLAAQCATMWRDL